MSHAHPRLLTLTCGVLALAATSWLLARRPSAAQESKTVVVFQCRLAQNGVPLEGDLTLYFQWFEAASGGTAIEGWSETLAVTARRGLISVRLGEQTSLATIFADDAAGTTNRYLSVKLGGASGPEILVPRPKLTATPFALSAATASVASALHSPTGQSLSADAIPILSGRSGGQVILGGTQNDDGLTLRGTSASGGFVVLVDTAQVDSKLHLKHIATPGSVPTSYTALYGKSDGRVYHLPYNGSEAEPGSSTEDAVPGTADGRLSVSSTAPVGTSASNRGTSLYYLEYCGNQVALHTGSSWRYHDITGVAGVVSITSTGLTSNKNYDAFLYSNAGSLTLELTAWTNDATRATSIVRQDGVWVRSGATTRRYLGTVRTISDGSVKFVDEPHLRFVWNAQNRVHTSSYTSESTDSWSINTSWDLPGAGASVWKWELVVGLAGQEPAAAAAVFARTGASYGCVLAVVADTTTPSTTSPSAWPSTYQGNAGDQVGALYQESLSVGYHYVNALNRAATGTPVTVYGDNANFDTVQSGMWFSVWR